VSFCIVCIEGLKNELPLSGWKLFDGAGVLSAHANWGIQISKAIQATMVMI
jgi:hypothetical protein